ncbi:hypothetical protein LYNGBM3L_00600 [Moorena producens 3L]|uniref:Uncharacterized protein n=1 Tax=Moorena producens 3L TaxID=489825 RepID=F4XI33_9CYAN|nr:hypothetical protein LYNGBM3L_00600 [Moorena producens 3L]OLT65955.1 hypothetical protein BI334_13800 [Moorena producens 3L]
MTEGSVYGCDQYNLSQGLSNRVRESSTLGLTIFFQDQKPYLLLWQNHHSLLVLETFEIKIASEAVLLNG